MERAYVTSQVVLCLKSNATSDKVMQGGVKRGLKKNFRDDGSLPIYMCTYEDVF